jgi:hypothetical protein
MAFDWNELGQALGGAAGAINNFRRQSALADLGAKLQSGDYKGAARTALAVGDVGTGLSLLQFGLQREADAQATSLAGGGIGLSGGISSPAPSQSPLASLSSGDSPRGIRNMNPGNIEAGGFAQSQPGYVGSDGRFAKFDTMEHGVGAQSALLQRYGNKGINTVAGVINRWAPQAENVAATGNYANFVARKIGVDPNAPIDLSNPETRQRLAYAMDEFENGRPLGNTGQAIRVADASGRIPQSAGDDDERASLDRRRTQIESALSVQGISPAKERALKIGLDSINRRLAELAPTSAVKEYNLAKQQEFTGSFMDFKKASAPGTQVNFQQEKEYEKTVGKGYGETMLELQKAGRSAPSSITSLNLLERATQTPGYYSGTAEPLINAARKAAVALGAADAANAAPNEIFNKVSNKLVLDLAGGSLGTGFSNADRDYLAGTVPNLANTPEGNRQIIGIMKSVEQRKIEIAKLARDYAKANNGRIDAGFDDQLAQWAEANPLFKSAPASQAQQQQTRQLRSPPSDVLEQARAAIKTKGRDAVIQRLRENGFDAGGL